jgi:hypothetical protein
VRALKYPIDKLDQMEQLKGSKDLWIDIVKNSTPSILEGQKVRLQAEEIFWVYTNEKQLYEST